MINIFKLPLSFLLLSADPLSLLPFRPFLLSPVSLSLSLPLIFLLPYPFSLFSLLPEPLLLLPLSLLFSEPLLILSLDPVLLSLGSTLDTELLEAFLSLLFLLLGEDLLSLELPGLSDFGTDAQVLRGYRFVDEEGRQVAEGNSYDGRADQREVDPDEAVHVGHALLIEAAES